MRSTLPAVPLLGWLLAACAAGRTAVELPAPDTTALAARAAEHRDDPGRLLEIGIGFYQARAYERSRDVLLAALALQPQAFHAAVQLGLAHEALGEFDLALAAYRRAQAMRVGRAERNAVEERVIALTRARLAAEARRAIAAEQALAATPPVPNTIAVLPWSYLGADPELKPLERGLAHLIVSDLAKVSRLTLLERERVQALTDELALDAAGRIEPGTAARSGRLLRAAEVVQGSIRETTGGAIRLDANVVDATTAEIRAAGSTSDRLQELLAMEKTLVLGLLERMGIPLTPAESRALAERPTADLTAFLAFSRGLEAEDRGAFSEAARFFQQAVQRDPGFQAAAQRAVQSRRIGAAGGMSRERLALAVRDRAGGRPSAIRAGAYGVRGAQLASALQGIAPTLAGRLTLRPGKASALKPRLAEALRQDDPTRLGTIGQLVVTIPRP